MKATLIQLAIATILLPVPGMAQEAKGKPVEVNVEGLPPHVQERIRREAQKGPEALIQYLHRTQSVHQLRAQFVIRSDAPQVAAAVKEPSKVAEAAPANPR